MADSKPTGDERKEMYIHSLLQGQHKHKVLLPIQRQCNQRGKRAKVPWSGTRPTPHFQQTCRVHSRPMRLEAQHPAHHFSQKLETQYKNITCNIPIQFSHSCILQTYMHKLQVIQNKAIRIIFHLPFDTNTQLYNITQNIHTVKSRLLYLTNKYLCYSLVKHSPLITNLFSEFIESYNSIIRDNNCKTLICSFLHSFSIVQ